MVEQFKPRNREEWETQRDWLDKHLKAGATMVVDETTNAVIRMEYDNPIYHYYKRNYEERKVLLAELGLVVKELGWLSNGKTPDMPPEIKTALARIYKKHNKRV